MHHGLSRELFDREMAKARAEKNEVRLAVLNAAYDIADHIDFEHMHTMVDLDRLQSLVERKIRFARLISK
jgi:hypothetical protein